MIESFEYEGIDPSQSYENGTLIKINVKFNDVVTYVVARDFSARLYDSETGRYEVISCSGDTTTIGASADHGAYSTTKCMFVVSRVNSVDLTNYLSALNADTKSPWLQGFETVAIKAGATTDSAIANGTYVYDYDDLYSFELMDLYIFYIFDHCLLPL